LKWKKIVLAESLMCNRKSPVADGYDKDGTSL
jgi:hypothetical protein